MSEPIRIGEILPAVMVDIKARMDQRRSSQHRRRVISATRDFLSGKNRPKREKPQESQFAKKQQFLF